ncbi:MAG TPA: TRAP transporter small permease [Bradyrhizobium sp.]|nr:TRAP transporter small permease [Bradyrhizobium sp.]
MDAGVGEGEPASFGWLDWTLGLTIAITLFLMMWITFVDVVGRYVFNSPLQGAYEITELSLAVLVFGGLPLVTERQEHVATPLFDHFLRGLALQLKSLAVDLTGLVACSVLAWRLWIQAGTTASLHTQTQVLHIDTAPFVYFMAITSAISGLTLLLRVVRSLSHLAGLQR